MSKGKEIEALKRRIAACQIAWKQADKEAHLAAARIINPNSLEGKSAGEINKLRLEAMSAKRKIKRYEQALNRLKARLKAMKKKQKVSQLMKGMKAGKRTKKRRL